MTTRITKSQLLDTKEAADFLGLSPTTLTTWRCKKRYKLRYIKVGGQVRYEADDLLAWLASRKVTPGAELQAV